ncbi:MAG: DUF4296 domain-containing protein [Sphingobacteriales bacterium]
MQKYKSLFFSLLLFVCACGSDKTPKDVLSNKTMVGLLTEIHIADGSVFNTVQIPDSVYKYATGRYLFIFKSFHTDSVQFRKSMKYYAGKPEVLEKIYEQVKANINIKTDSLNKINKAQIERDTKRRNDSLSKLPKKPAVQQQPVTTPPPAIPPGQKPTAPFQNKRYRYLGPKKHVVNPIK